MITICNKIDLLDTYPLERLGELEELLFFDIETTGFSGDYSNLYLIGGTYFRDGSWNLTQWFADDSDSEVEILEAFFEFMKEFRKLVHFNGDGFDIPYLLKRCRFFGLSYDFSNIESIDIYRRIKPYKKLLGLENLKQKSIERFLGINRKDLYSGGELIEVYKDYLITGEQELYDMLILHNEEDLKGMPLILPILSYSDFLDHELAVKACEIREKKDVFGDGYQELLLQCQSQYTIPVTFEQCREMASCTATGNLLTIKIPLYEGELKYYYDNYKDYYYLIYEDTAVHKSVGEYVDKEAKRKATAKTCYSKKHGRFLPQFSRIWQPALQRDYKDKVTFAEFKEELLNDPQTCQVYAADVLYYLLGKVFDLRG